MDFNIGAEQKAEILSSIEKQLKVDVFGTLVRLGIDPDLFTDEDDLPDPMSVPAMIPEIDRLKQNLTALNMIKEKMSAD